MTEITVWFLMSIAAFTGGTQQPVVPREFKSHTACNTALRNVTTEVRKVDSTYKGKDLICVRMTVLDRN